MAVMAGMTSRIRSSVAWTWWRSAARRNGRIKTRTADGQDVELRLSTLPTAFGEKLVMRVFDPEVIVKDFSELGFSEDDKTRWKQMTGQPNGIVLVTGPTGSGKTTTLYSTLKTLATPEVNVCTIEDPIEMIEPSFNQMQVQQSDRPRLRRGRARVMRQDPDIIMVGEIRDLATAEMAIQAASRAPGSLHAAHQRLRQRDHAAARARGAGLPAQLDHPRGDGAAPGAHAVQALQGKNRLRSGARRRLELGGVRRALEGEASGAHLPAGGLPGMPQHRLHGPHRPVRDPAAFPRR